MPAVPVAVPVTPAGTAATTGDAGAEPGEFASLMAGLLGEDAPAVDPTVDPAAPADPSLVDPALVGAAGAPGRHAGPGRAARPGHAGHQGPDDPDDAAADARTHRRTGPAGPGSRPVDDGGDGAAAPTAARTGVVGQGPAHAGSPDRPRHPGPADARRRHSSPAPGDRHRPAPRPCRPLLRPPVPTATADTALQRCRTGDPAGRRPDGGHTPAAPPPVDLRPARTAPAHRSGRRGATVGARARRPQPTAPTRSPPRCSRRSTGCGRASSAGDGTHRITLNLNPETLGEVRVTLTVPRRRDEGQPPARPRGRAALMADSMPPSSGACSQRAGATRRRRIVVTRTCRRRQPRTLPTRRTSGSDLDRSGSRRQHQQRAPTPAAGDATDARRPPSPRMARRSGRHAGHREPGRARPGPCHRSAGLDVTM